MLLFIDTSKFLGDFERSKIQVKSLEIVSEVPLDGRSLLLLSRLRYAGVLVVDKVLI